MHRDRKILPQDKRRTTLNAGRLKDSTRQRLGFCAWESLPRLRCGLALGSPGSWFGVIIRGAATHEPRFYRPLFYEHVVQTQVVPRGKDGLHCTPEKESSTSRT